VAYTTIGASILCGLVLLMSVASKVRSRADYAEFVASVPAFGLPSRWTRQFAAATAAAELVTAGLLLPAAALVPFGHGHWLAGAGLLFAVALFGVLTAAVWRAVARGTGAVCRCFGPARTRLGRRHVVRNAVLLLAAAIGLVQLSVVDVADPAIAGLAAAAGALGAVLVIRFDDLAELVLA
jgi:hypothetical protein